MLVVAACRLSVSWSSSLCCVVVVFVVVCFVVVVVVPVVSKSPLRAHVHPLATDVALKVACGGLRVVVSGKNVLLPCDRELPEVAPTAGSDVPSFKQLRAKPKKKAGGLGGSASLLVLFSSLLTSHLGCSSFNFQGIPLARS